MKAHTSGVTIILRVLAGIIIAMVVLIVAGIAWAISLGPSETAEQAPVKTVEVIKKVEVVREVEVPGKLPEACANITSLASDIAKAGDLISKKAGEHKAIMERAGKAIAMDDLIALNTESRNNRLTQEDMSQGYRDMTNAITKLERAVELCSAKQ